MAGIIEPFYLNLLIIQIIVFSLSVFLMLKGMNVLKVVTFGLFASDIGALGI